MIKLVSQRRLTHSLLIVTSRVITQDWVQYHTYCLPITQDCTNRNREAGRTQRKRCAPHHTNHRRPASNTNKSKQTTCTQQQRRHKVFSSLAFVQMFTTKHRRCVHRNHNNDLPSRRRRSPRYFFVGRSFRRTTVSTATIDTPTTLCMVISRGGSASYSGACYGLAAFGWRHFRAWCAMSGNNA